MSVLRNLEAKLGGLVEGAFSRAFKSSVEPVELARKLAKEMEDVQAGLRLAGLRAEPLPRLPLAPGPRAVLELRAGAAQGAVRLPARARARGAPGAHQPPGGRVHDRRAAVARRVRHPGAAAHAARGGGGPRGGRPDVAPSQGDFGHTMVYSPDKEVRKLDPVPVAPTRAVLAGGGQAHGARGQPRGRSAAAASATCRWTTRTCRAATPSCATSAAAGTSSTSAPPTAIKVNRRRVDAGRAAPRRPHHAGRHRPRLRARVGGPGPWTSRSRWR